MTFEVLVAFGESLIPHILLVYVLDVARDHINLLVVILILRLGCLLRACSLIEPRHCRRLVIHFILAQTIVSLHEFLPSAERSSFHKIVRGTIKSGPLICDVACRGIADDDFGFVGLNGGNSGCASEILHGRLRFSHRLERVCAQFKLCFFGLEGSFS